MSKNLTGNPKEILEHCTGFFFYVKIYIHVNLDSGTFYCIWNFYKANAIAPSIVGTGLVHSL